MTASPRFSVVIPLYNKVAYVRRAIDSVLAQTLEDFELVVVDDGSTDGSGELVTSYRDPRIRYFRQSNAGECAARNRGIEEARSEWISYLDADDEYLPEFLAEIDAVRRQYPGVCVIFTNLTVLSEVGEREAWRASDLSGPQIVDDYFRFCLVRRSGMSSSSTATTREVIRRVGGFPVGVTLGGDLDTWARLAWSAGEVGAVPKRLAVWHTEVVGSQWVVERDGRRQRRVPPYSAYQATYRQWLTEGKIPEQLLKSTHEWMNRRLIDLAAKWARVGARGEGLALLLREADPSLAPVAYARALLLTLCPSRIVAALRRLRSLSWRSAKYNSGDVVTVAEPAPGSCVGFTSASTIQAPPSSQTQAPMKVPRSR
jgi:glycosyltransferase involved in cell wall biosynthesis